MLRLAALCLTVLFFAGCGFTPMYGSSKQGTLNAVEISLIPDREGQYLRNRLIDRFYSGNARADSRYVLDVSRIEEKRTELDITKSSTTTRAELKIMADAVLKDKRTGKTVMSRAFHATGSYNVLSSQFTTRVSEDNTRLGALDDLARQIEQAVVLNLKN